MDIIDDLRGVQNPFVSGIELWGPGTELVLQSLVRKEQGDENWYLSVSVHKQAKSPTELKAAMLCDGTWLPVTTKIPIKVCIDLI